VSDQAAPDANAYQTAAANPRQTKNGPKKANRDQNLLVGWKSYPISAFSPLICGNFFDTFVSNIPIPLALGFKTPIDEKNYLPLSYTFHFRLLPCAMLIAIIFLQDRISNNREWFGG